MDFDNGVGPLADPFADVHDQDNTVSSKDYVHIRVQQRNGKKSLTTIQVAPGALSVFTARGL